MAWGAVGGVVGEGLRIGRVSEPSVEVWPVVSGGADGGSGGSGASGGGVRIEVVGTRGPDPAGVAARVDAAWAGLCRANPALYDGPFLSVEGYEPGTQRFRCVVDRYRRLAVRGAVETGADLLSVTGLFTAVDERGRECVLLGERGPGVRVYPGLWEIGPAGGVDPPGGSLPVTMGVAEVEAHLRVEAEEEAGLRLGDAGGDGGEGVVSASRAEAVAVVRNVAAYSHDVVLHVRVGEVVERLEAAGVAGSGEYSRVAWVPVEGLGAFEGVRTGRVIPQTAALVRALGWGEAWSVAGGAAGQA